MKRKKYKLHQNKFFAYTILPRIFIYILFFSTLFVNFDMNEIFCRYWGNIWTNFFLFWWNRVLLFDLKWNRERERKKVKSNEFRRFKKSTRGKEMRTFSPREQKRMDCFDAKGVWYVPRAWAVTRVLCTSASICLSPSPSGPASLSLRFAMFASRLTFVRTHSKRLCNPPYFFFFFFLKLSDESSHFSWDVRA